MKIAILFFGIHYLESYQHWFNKENFKINFAESVYNYKKFLPLENEIEYYLSTYDSPKIRELKDTFKNSKIILNEYKNDNNIYQANLLISIGLESIIKSNNNYDIILITRFD